jgi:hypothetical protein
LSPLLILLSTIGLHLDTAIAAVVSSVVSSVVIAVGDVKWGHSPKRGWLGVASLLRHLMHGLLVVLEILSRSKATVTGGAGEWPLARVGALVDNQVPLFAVSLGAEVARKWLCASVSQLVAGQLALAREHLAANVALDKPHGASPAHTARLPQKRRGSGSSAHRR